MTSANADTASEMKLFSRLKGYLVTGLGRLGSNSWPVIQTAAAASVAYFLATFILGSQQAFYAPIAAIVCLSVSLTQPWRRAVLVTIGIAVGLTLANLIVLVIGVGSAQIMVVVALAMGAALLLSDSTLLVNQAA